jgi:flagellar protein FlaG
MSVGFPTVGGAGRAERALAAVPEPKPTPESSFAERFDAAVEAGPPPEVRAEVQAALRSADRLREQGRRLHFEHDPQTGDLRIELRDLEGNVVRRVPPAEVFDFAAGKAVR